MNEAALVATWMQDGSALREVIERALSDALNGTDHEWYLARGEGFDRYVLYPRSQPWAEGLLEHWWSERSPWPEGQFFTVDVSLERQQLILIHSNDTRNERSNLRNVIMHTATTVSLHALAHLLVNARARAMFEQHGELSSLAEIIRWMIETRAPNYFSVT